MGFSKRKRQRTRKCQTCLSMLFGTQNRQTAPSPPPQSKSPCTNSPHPHSVFASNISKTCNVSVVYTLMFSIRVVGPPHSGSLTSALLEARRQKLRTKTKRQRKLNKKRWQESCTNAIFQKEGLQEKFPHPWRVFRGTGGMGSCAYRQRS